MVRATRKNATRRQAQRGRSTKRRVGKRGSNNQSHFKWWIATACCLGLGLVGVSVKYVSDHRANKPVIAKKVEKSFKKKIAKKSFQDAPPDPRFEFYNILPKISVPTKQANVSLKTNQFKYDVQVASTRSQKDAEQMRAKIILHGLDAHVVKVKTTKGLWYRVALGPYPTRTDASSVLKQLRQNDIDGVIRPVK